MGIFRGAVAVACGTLCCISTCCSRPKFSQRNRTALCREANFKEDFWGSMGHVKGVHRIPFAFLRS